MSSLLFLMIKFNLYDFYNIFVSVVCLRVRTYIMDILQYIK